jgi:hypothetical protein
LFQGTYAFTVSATDWHTVNVFDYHDRRYEFNVVAPNPEESQGLIRMHTSWRHQREAADSEVPSAVVRA